MRFRSRERPQRATNSGTSQIHLNQHRNPPQLRNRKEKSGCKPDGTIDLNTQSYCDQQGGTAYQTEAEAITACEGEELEGEIWCCKPDGTIDLNTQSYCDQQGGTAYQTEAEAVAACEGEELEGSAGRHLVRDGSRGTDRLRAASNRGSRRAVSLQQDKYFHLHHLQ